MITIEITIPGLEAALAKMRNWDNYANQRFTEAMKKSVIIASNEIKKLTPIGASGTLRKSIYSTVTNAGVGSVVGRVGSSAKTYAYYANYGRKPGKMPPVDKLVLWVQRKQLAGIYSIRSSGGGLQGYHRRLGSKTTQAGQDRQVAYLIARAIGKHGTKATNFMENGIKAAMPQILANFNRALDLIKSDLTKGAPGAAAGGFKVDLD
jgi:hypothetical protein